MERGPPKILPRLIHDTIKKEGTKVYNVKIRIGKMFWYPLVTVYHLAVIFGILALFWFGASMVEIFFKNMNPDAIYSSWNYFAAIR